MDLYPDEIMTEGMKKKMVEEAKGKSKGDLGIEYLNPQ